MIFIVNASKYLVMLIVDIVIIITKKHVFSLVCVCVCVSFYSQESPHVTSSYDVISHHQHDTPLPSWDLHGTPRHVQTSSLGCHQRGPSTYQLEIGWLVFD